MAANRLPGTSGSPLTAKGDLFGYGAGTSTRVPVGSDGTTLLADSSSAAGVSYQPLFAAGRNRIINGDFGVWQRGTSSSTLGAYTTADRWYISGGGTITAAQETSVVPTNFKYALRMTAGASSSFGEAYQPIENMSVIPLLGQTVTLSVYVRVNGTYAGVPSIELQGNTSSDTMSGGSWSSVAYVNAASAPTAAYTRLTLTTTIPTNLVGLRVRLANSAAQSSGAIIYYAGAQLEAGSVATPFTTATGTVQGELALCQRYLPVFGGTSATDILGFAFSTTAANIYGTFAVTPRVPPTGILISALSNYRIYNVANAFGNPTALVFTEAGLQTFQLTSTTTAGTPLLAQGQPVELYMSVGQILFTGCEL